MIYLDNSATSYPKPQGVRQAVQRAMVEEGANPGRSSYGMCFRTTQALYGVRQQAADFFGAAGPECVAFQPSCTQALNVVLKGCLKPGDHVVASDLEHNAVMRPLEALKARGVTCTLARTAPGDNDATLDAFRKAIGPKTRLVVCTMASNVFGVCLPVERITAHQPGGERHRLPVLRRAQGTIRPHGHGPAGAPPAGRAPSHPGGGGDGHPVPQPGDAR